jgi:hypothetical protein
MDNKSLSDIGKEVGELCEEKNRAYGDSFAKAGVILAGLYPHGVAPHQYTDMLGVIRVLDKLFRIATQKMAFGESPWRDIAGYGILGTFNDQNHYDDLLRQLDPPEEGEEVDRLIGDFNREAALATQIAQAKHELREEYWESPGPGHLPPIAERGWTLPDGSPIVHVPDESVASTGGLRLPDGSPITDVPDELAVFEELLCADCISSMVPPDDMPCKKCIDKPYRPHWRQSKG